MKINSNAKIDNENVILVPYKKHHVPKYHAWMQNEELQIATASSPLSLKEEYEMQKTWLLDEDKCTFIVLDANTYNNNQDDIEAMIGDTNIFVLNEENKKVGEIEIMIAEKKFRRNQRGWNSTLSMLRYGIEVLGITKFVAKIGIDNEKSLRLFKKLKFIEESFSNVFQEVTLAVDVTSEWKSWIIENTLLYKISTIL